MPAPASWGDPTSLNFSTTRSSGRPQIVLKQAGQNSHCCSVQAGRGDPSFRCGVITAMITAGLNARTMSARGGQFSSLQVKRVRRACMDGCKGPQITPTGIRSDEARGPDLAERGMTAFETEALESCRSLAMDPAGLFSVDALVEIRPECAKKPARE